MQQPINDTIHLRETSNPADSAQEVEAIDYGSDFKDKIDKINKL